MNTNLNFKTYREPPKIGVATTSTLRLFVFFISSSAFSFNVTHIHSPECMYKSVHTHKFCHMLGYTWHWPMVKENRDIALPSHLLPVCQPLLCVRANSPKSPWESRMNKSRICYYTMDARLPFPQMLSVVSLLAPEMWNIWCAVTLWLRI